MISKATKSWLDMHYGLHLGRSILRNTADHMDILNTPQRTPTLWPQQGFYQETQLYHELLQVLIGNPLWQNQLAWVHASRGVAQHSWDVHILWTKWREQTGTTNDRPGLIPILEATCKDMMHDTFSDSTVNQDIPKWPFFGIKQHWKLV